MMVDDTPIYVNTPKIENVPGTETQHQRQKARQKFKEESRPDGQHSPNNMLEETILQLMHTASIDTRRGNMGTHQSGK